MPIVIIDGVTYAPITGNYADASSIAKSGKSKVEGIKLLRNHYNWSLKRSKLFYEILMDDEWERIELLNKDLFAQLENLEQLVKQKQTRINLLDHKLAAIVDAINGDKTPDYYDEYKEDMNCNDEWDSRD